MNAEKFSLNQQNEYALKSRLSQYKIHLAMKHPPNRTYYGTESCTMQKIVNRHLPIVLFNGERGLANCVAIQQRYRGQYHHATIYQRIPGGHWKPCAEYPDELETMPELPRPPAPVIMMRVFHDPLKGTVTFIKKAA